MDAGELTPDAIMSVAIGFMASKQLFVATEIGMFEALRDDALTLEDLAKRTRVPVRTMRIVADAMVALGFLEAKDGRYRNVPVTDAFLSGRSGRDLRPGLRYLNRFTYRLWLRFEDAIPAGSGPERFPELTAEEQPLVSAGIASIGEGAALALPQKYDFSKHRHVLDLGGGTGWFLVPILARSPAIHGTLYELPGAASVAKRTLVDRVEGSRIDVVAGDFFADDLPSADVVLAANIVHLFTPARNRIFFERIRRSIAGDGRLLLVDFWTDETRTRPLAAALQVGTFLMMGGEGDVYSVHDVAEWLEQTGWKVIDHRALAGPPRGRTRMR